MKLKSAILIVIMTFSIGDYFSQIMKNGKQMILVNVLIHEGDTIPIFHMPVVSVVADGRKSKAFRKKYARLKKKIIKVYPYANEARKLLDEYETDLLSMEDKKDKKKYLKKAEKKLKEEFAGVLKDMTTSEGRVLIKLIDRETQRSTYELVEQLKGGGSAFMWQGVARIFGSNLKDKYDPVDEDFLMESIVRKIESGEIGLTAQN